MSHTEQTETTTVIAKGQVWAHVADGERRRVKAAEDATIHLVPVDLPESAWFLSPFATQWERSYFLERHTLVTDAD